MNYTKGEWKVYKVAAAYLVNTGNMVNVADCRLEANANLIAAAPDMYEALKKIELFLQDPDVKVMAKGLPNQIGLEITFEKCQQALAKAEGKE